MRMNLRNNTPLIWLVLAFTCVCNTVFSQTVLWENEGSSYFQLEKNQVVRYSLPANAPEVFISSADLSPVGKDPLAVRDFSLSKDQKKALIYTNTKRVWRLDTQGDYWVFDLQTKGLKQVGEGLPESSLRFAKLSPDASQIAYVSEFNLFVEDLNTGQITQLTFDGNRKLINGTFDWAYEEEFACRDGFQWSPDGKKIAFWQIDANQIRDYLMMNFTDSVYSRVVPVEYPKVGESPSPARIGVIDLVSKQTNWLPIPGDPQQHYLPRMEWNNPDLLLVQQLNRKQNHSRLFAVNISKNKAELISEEVEETWIDVLSNW